MIYLFIFGSFFLKFKNCFEKSNPVILAHKNKNEDNPFSMPLIAGTNSLARPKYNN